MQSVLLVLISKSEETRCQQGKKCCEKFKMHWNSGMQVSSIHYQLSSHGILKRKPLLHYEVRAMFNYLQNLNFEFWKKEEIVRE